MVFLTVPMASWEGLRSGGGGEGEEEWSGVKGWSVDEGGEEEEE